MRDRAWRREQAERKRKEKGKIGTVHKRTRGCVNYCPWCEKNRTRMQKRENSRGPAGEMDQ